jgi:hypothetical protein
MFPPYTVDISSYLSEGENTLELRIINNLRNMQGPLHLNAPDTAGIAPSSFFREANVFHSLPGKGEECHDTLPQYNDKYGLVYFGLKHYVAKEPQTNRSQ